MPWLIGGGVLAVLAVALILFLVLRSSDSARGKENLAGAKQNQLPDPAFTVFPKVKGPDPLKPPAELKRLIDRLDQTDPGWRLVEIEMKRPAISPEKNGALLAASVASSLPTGWDAPLLKVNFDPTLTPLQELPQVEVAALRTVLKKQEREVAEARKLNSFAVGRFRVAYDLNFLKTNLECTGHVHNIGKLLTSDALLRCHEGDGPGAMESCRAALHALSYVAQEPTAVGDRGIAILHTNCVNCLERALATRKAPTSEQLLQTQAFLEEEARRPRLYNILRAERAGGYFTCTNLYNGDLLEGASLLTGVPWYLDHMTQAIEIARGPEHLQRTKLHELTRSIGNEPIGAKAMLPAYTKTADYCFAVTAALRVAAAGLAVERFRRLKGQWPARLDQLVADFIKSVPLDPFTGDPLTGVQRPESLVVYCLAARPDQGGAVINYGTGNIGFRLVEMKRRR
jgi:hypothetical protein